MIGQYKKMTDNYNYFYFIIITYIIITCIITCILKIIYILKMSFKTSFKTPEKRREKVCPDAPRGKRTKSSNQNEEIKPIILFPDFELSDLDFFTPDNGITYDEQGAPIKKEKTISYSSELLNSLKKNLYEEHFSKSSKYALKLRKKIDDNNKKIVMNYVKKLLKDLKY